jgi:hypothetical protein
MKTEPTLYWMIFHFIQILLFNFYFARKQSHLTFHLLRKRNEVELDKILKHERLHSPIIDYTIGSIALFLLISGFQNNDPNLYWAGKYFSLFGFLFTVLGVDLYMYEKLKKRIPLISKRSADLKARNFGSTVPKWCWAIFLITSSIALFSIQTTKGMLIQIGTIIFIIMSGLMVEKRSKLPVKKTDDKEYRKNEGWTIFVIGMSLGIAPIVNRYIGHYGIDAIYSTIPLIAFIILLNSKIYKKITFKEVPLTS